MTTIWTIPQGLTAPLDDTPVVSPPFSTIITSDRFLRTGAIGSTDAGLGGAVMAWTGDTAKFNANNGYAQPNVNTIWRLAVAQSSQLNAEQSAIIRALPSDATVNMDVRRQGTLTGSGNAYYRLRMNKLLAYLEYYNGSASVSLGAAPVPFAIGDRIGVRMDGSTLSMLKNNAIVASVTDATIAAAGHFNLTGVSGTISGFQFTDYILKVK